MRRRPRSISPSDVRVDLLVDARHAGSIVGRTAASASLDPQRVGDERDRRAVVRRREVQQPAEAVRERQEEEHHVVVAPCSRMSLTTRIIA